MVDDIDATVELDAHRSRSLATTILMAGQLLGHDDIDAAQHPAIERALVRAATALAHEVVAAEVRPVDEVVDLEPRTART